jgi:methylenetetrahydrofolate--tRNA-(uracil-5-)-methyltransferase
MDEQQYNDLVDALLSADLVTPHDFEDTAVFEGCMPVEQIAKRGRQTLAFGPLRPVGLFEPVTGKRFFAVLQLRKENIAGDSYNLVGFQTRMTFSEQQRVFRMIPGLENAEFLRYGVMHRNTYINSPALLDGNLRLRSDPRIQFAGQITGVEGYVESCASGLMAALMAHDPKLFGPPAKSMMGALHQYVTGYKGKDFQPMAANFGLLPFPARKIRKKERKQFYHERGVEKFTEWVKENLE